MPLPLRLCLHACACAGCVGVSAEYGRRGSSGEVASSSEADSRRLAQGRNEGAGEGRRLKGSACAYACPLCLCLRRVRCEMPPLTSKVLVPLAIKHGRCLPCCVVQPRAHPSRTQVSHPPHIVQGQKQEEETCRGYPAGASGRIRPSFSCSWSSSQPCPPS